MATREYRWRHLALLISILLLFTVTPFAARFRHGTLIADIAATTILVAAAYALSERKHLFTIAIVLSVITILAATLLLVFPQQPVVVILEHGCVVVLIVFFSLSILGYVLRTGRVTIDRIFAAVSVYLLIGFAWTFAYAFLEDIQPDAFTNLIEMSPNANLARVMELRYFSFMTLTTVGYGDILPRSTTARTMAALEAVTGQIYLAVLVARLVGLHIVHSHISQSRNKD